MITKEPNTIDYYTIKRKDIAIRISEKEILDISKLNRYHISNIELEEDKKRAKRRRRHKRVLYYKKSRRNQK